MLLLSVILLEVVIQATGSTGLYSHEKVFHHSFQNSHWTRLPGEFCLLLFSCIYLALSLVGKGLGMRLAYT